MTLDRRIIALENKADTDADDDTVDWGPGFDHLPPCTVGGLRAMLKCMHESGAGRLSVKSHSARLQAETEAKNREAAP